MEPSLPPLRSGLITRLGTLSFINTGLFILLYSLGLVFAAAARQLPYERYEAMMRPQVEQFAQGDEVAPMLEMMDLLYWNGVPFMALLLLRTVARLAGVLGIWKGRMWGFHAYAVAQLAGIFLPHLVLPLKYLGLGGALCAIGCTALYGTQRHTLS